MIKLQSNFRFLLIELFAEIVELSFLAGHDILSIGYEIINGDYSLLSRLRPDCFIILFKLHAQKLVSKIDPMTIRKTRYLSVADSLVAICVTK